MSTIRRMKLVPEEFDINDGSDQNQYYKSQQPERAKESAVNRVYHNLHNEINSILNNDYNTNPEILAKLLGVALKKFYIYRVKTHNNDEPLITILNDDDEESRKIKLEVQEPTEPVKKKYRHNDMLDP